MDTAGVNNQPTNILYIQAGQIYPYVGSPGPYHCPADYSTYLAGVPYPIGGKGKRPRSQHVHECVDGAVTAVGPGRRFIHTIPNLPQGCRFSRPRRLSLVAVN